MAQSLKRLLRRFYESIRNTTQRDEIAAGEQTTRYILSTRRLSASKQTCKVWSSFAGKQKGAYAAMGNDNRPRKRARLSLTGAAVIDNPGKRLNRAGMAMRASRRATLRPAQV